MERKAALADGTRPGLPCASPGQVSDACSRVVTARPEWCLLRGGNRVSAWEVLRIALLRDIAGLSGSEIGRLLSVGDSSVKRRYQIHRAWMESMGEYRDVVGAVAGECLRG